jgi:hypothetical protein
MEKLAEGRIVTSYIELIYSRQEAKDRGCSYKIISLLEFAPYSWPFIKTARRGKVLSWFGQFLQIDSSVGIFNQPAAVR